MIPRRSERSDLTLVSSWRKSLGLSMTSTSPMPFSQGVLFDLSRGYGTSSSIFTLFTVLYSTVNFFLPSSVPSPSREGAHVFMTLTTSLQRRIASLPNTVQKPQGISRSRRIRPEATIPYRSLSYTWPCARSELEISSTTAKCRMPLSYSGPFYSLQILRRVTDSEDIFSGD